MESESTVANIGGRQRRLRLLGGVAALGGAILLAGVLLRIDAPVLLRAVVFLPLMAAAMGFLQYREKT